MPRGSIVLAVALAVAFVAPGTGTTEPPAGAGDEFLATAAAECTDIINGRSFEQWDASSAAGVDMLTFAIDPPSAGAEPTDDELDAWAGAIESQRDELAEARDRLAELQERADAAGNDFGLAWSEVVIAGGGLITALTAQLDELTSGRPWATIAAELVPLPTPMPTSDSLAALGMVLRDCERVFTHQGVPDEHRAFVAPAAAACSAALTRRTANGYFDDETTLFAAGSVLYDGAPIELSDELAAAVDRRVAENATTRSDLSAVPTDAVPDPAAWQLWLDYEQALIDYYTAIAAAIETGDPVAVAAAIQVVIDVPVNPDPLAAVFLNDRDCQLLYSASDPVPGSGIAPTSAP